MNASDIMMGIQQGVFKIASQLGYLTVIGCVWVVWDMVKYILRTREAAKRDSVWRGLYKEAGE